ncbi:hypothetical protein L7F22_016818 [Adiantum nelumboides]|nr:hypothetical protein [Adiantum nelumboides]
MVQSRTVPRIWSAKPIEVKPVHGVYVESSICMVPMLKKDELINEYKLELLGDKRRDRADESTSYGKETKPDEPKLVKVKLPDYVFEDMVIANIQEDQGTEQANMHNEDQVERSRPTGDDKQDDDDAIENEFLSSLVEYDATEEQVFEEKVIEADKLVVLIDLKGPIDEEELEDASTNCMAGKEESKESKMELPMLQVCSMTNIGDSQVKAKLLKEVCVWWLKGMMISVAIQKAIELVQVLLEEEFTLYGWEGGSYMFYENDYLVGDTFDGVLWEVNSLPMDVGGSERVPRAAYVDNWLDAQEVQQPQDPDSGHQEESDNPPANPRTRSTHLTNFSRNCLPTVLGAQEGILKDFPEDQESRSPEFQERNTTRRCIPGNQEREGEGVLGYKKEAMQGSNPGDQEEVEEERNFGSQERIDIHERKGEKGTLEFQEQGAKQGNIPGYQEDVEEVGNPGAQERRMQRFIPGIQEKKEGEGIFGTQEKRAMRGSISGNQEREEEGRIPGTQGREETQSTSGD